MRRKGKERDSPALSSLFGSSRGKGRVVFRQLLLVDAPGVQELGCAQDILGFSKLFLCPAAAPTLPKGSAWALSGAEEEDGTQRLHFQPGAFPSLNQGWETSRNSLEPHKRSDGCRVDENELIPSCHQ